MTRPLRTAASVALGVSLALTLLCAGGSALAQPAGAVPAASPSTPPSGVQPPPSVATPDLARTGGPSVGAPARAPWISIDLGDGQTEGGFSPVLKVILLLVAMTFVPAMILATTSFTRIIIVLSLLRQGIGVMQLPPNRILVALAMFLTMFTMAPVFEQIHDEAIAPYDAGAMDEMQALDAATGPLRTFMLRHVREADLMLFLDISGTGQPQTEEDVPTLALIPAFILSELKTAFQMGALLFLPFLVIDIVVASILMSMGMMMLPPATISLPLKIIVFVVVDGWGLVVGSLVESLGA